MSYIRRRYQNKTILTRDKEVVEIIICKSSGGKGHCNNPDNCKYTKHYVYEQDPPINRKKIYKYIYHT
jgi:hypothetical protein